MIVHRRQMSRTAHRLGFGRVNKRLRRVVTTISHAPAPIGHNASLPSDIPPEWLKERPMSDDWNNNQQHQDHQDQYQPQQQHFETSAETPQELLTEPVAAGVDSSRLEAIEAALHEMRGHIHEIKAALAAPAAVEIADGPVAPETSEAVHEPVANDEPTKVEEPAVDTHGDRLAAIESELSSIKTLLGAVAHNLADIQSDVKSHTDLHAETKAIVDEQHQLMRGLNYIITSAIGTLTTAAKSGK
jgi:hypothetical protein